MNDFFQGWVFVDGDGTATVYEGFPAGTKPQFIKVLLKRRGDNPIKVSNFQIWACSPPGKN